MGSATGSRLTKMVSISVIARMDKYATILHLEDAAAQFDNGLEITQITGVNNAGQITGFYTDVSGVFNGFVADPASAPEPASLLLTGLGIARLRIARRKKACRESFTATPIFTH